jgi:hypothetical protein
MAFSSNELGFGSDHGIIFWNEAISDTHVSLWMERNATEADFCFVPRKVPFPYSEYQNQVFCEAATEKRNRKLGTTPHINTRPPGIHISALVSSYKPSEVYFGFCASFYRFWWNQVRFAL